MFQCEFEVSANNEYVKFVGFIHFFIIFFYNINSIVGGWLDGFLFQLTTQFIFTEMLGN